MRPMRCDFVAITCSGGVWGYLLCRVSVPKPHNLSGINLDTHHFPVLPLVVDWCQAQQPPKHALSPRRRQVRKPKLRRQSDPALEPGGQDVWTDASEPISSWGGVLVPGWHVKTGLNWLNQKWIHMPAQMVPTFWLNVRSKFMSRNSGRTTRKSYMSLCKSIATTRVAPSWVCGGWFCFAITWEIWNSLESFRNQSHGEMPLMFGTMVL